MQKKPKYFRSMSLCPIYTPQYITGKLEEFRTVQGTAITSTLRTRSLAGLPAVDATIMRLPGTLRRWSFAGLWTGSLRTRYLPPRQVEQAVPHKVKLPLFWEKDTAAWFKLAQAVPEGSHDINHDYLFIIFWPKENELGDQSNKKIIQQGQNVLSHLFCGHFSFTLVFFVGRHAVEEKRTVAIVCDNLQGVIHTLSYIPQAFPRYTTECRWDKLTWSFPHYILDGFGVSKQLQNILRNSLGFCASLIWLKMCIGQNLNI